MRAAQVMLLLFHHPKLVMAGLVPAMTETGLRKQRGVTWVARIRGP
jgi:hypothetical protein